VIESSYSLPVGGSLTVGSGASLLFAAGIGGTGSGSPVIPASVSSVPEPGTAGLLLVAAFGLGLVVFRRAFKTRTAGSYSSSRSDTMTVAVGFNPRTTVSPRHSVSRVATIENQPSLRDGEQYGSTANRGLKPVETYGYHRRSLRDQMRRWAGARYTGRVSQGI
jgi:hypothetical protein